MKKYVLLILFVIVLKAQAQFTVQDVRIVDATASYVDFEFWQQGNRFCFQDEKNACYVGLIDSLTGDLTSFSGKDFLLNNSLSPITQSINGPEWGYRQGGADVFFTKQTGTNRSIGKASWDGTGYTFTDLSVSLSGKRFATICSKNATYTIAKIVYAKGNTILNFTLHYSKAVNPVTNKINLLNSEGDENFILTNSVGQTIYSGKNIEQQSFSLLKSGVYLLQIQQNFNFQTVKLIKQ